MQTSSADNEDVISAADEIFVSPVFHQTPSDLEVTEGQTSRLDSIVIGRPNPDVSWYHNGQQLCNDRTHKLVINQDGVNSLIFQPASLSDDGIYRCVATNGGGEQSFEVSVRVMRKLSSTDSLLPPFTLFLLGLGFGLRLGLWLGLRLGLGLGIVDLLQLGLGFNKFAD